MQCLPHSKHSFTATEGHLTPGGEVVAFYSERRSNFVNIQWRKSENFVMLQ